jgi:hypothetical protein
VIVDHTSFQFLKLAGARVFPISQVRAFTIRLLTSVQISKFKVGGRL